MSGRGLAPPLADVLGVLLPDPMDTLLLRACVGGAASAASAWQGWLAAAGGLPKALTDRPASRALMPLLYHSLREHGIAVTEPSLAILRSAHLWELRRAGEIRTILYQITDTLHKAGISAIVTEGAAAGAAAYPAFELRHCHDVALLVEGTDLIRAHDLLTTIGLTHSADLQNGVRLLNTGGLPIVLRTVLWAPTEKAAPTADFRRRAVPARLDGHELTVFEPADMLLHICGQGIEATEPGRWEWIADAAMILRCQADTGLDWLALVRMAKEHGLAFRVSLRLGYLATWLDLPIPPAATEELAAAAWLGERREWERSLSVARGAFGIGMGAMLRQGGWRSKLAVAKWALRRSPRLIGMRALP